MAYKRYALLGLGAAGYAYFKKKENRDKAKELFQESKVKVQSLVDQAKQQVQQYQEPAQPTYKEEENRMLDEGAQTAVQYFNEKQEEEKQ